MHAKPHRPRRVAIVEQLSNLPIGHNTPGRNAADDCVNALTIFRIGLLNLFDLFFSVRPLCSLCLLWWSKGTSTTDTQRTQRLHRDYSKLLKTTLAGAPSPLLLLKRNGRQISSYLPAGMSLRFSPSRMITPCESST